MKNTEFLKFSDYQITKTEWTTVALSKEIRNDKDQMMEDYFIYPALLEIEKGSIKHFLTYPRWEVDKNFFGHPGVSDTFSGLKLSFEEDGNSYILHPFVIFRESNDFTDEKFEIIQNFALYFDTFEENEDEDTNKHCFIDFDGNIIDLIKTKVTEHYKEIMINTKYLEEFLDDYKVFLVRYFDNTRFYHGNDPSVKATEYNSKTSTSHYEIRVWDSGINFWISRMLGKDVLIPALNDNIVENEYSTYKFKDITGKIMVFTCEKEKLGNLFTKSDAPKFLTPVFFKSDVLQHYYNEPRIFKAGNLGIACLNFWSMPFEQLEDGIIQVYLGDLAKLPFNHQKHWKIYNIITDKGISYRRFMKDFQNDPQPTNNVFALFYGKMGKLDKISTEKFGSPLIKSLNEDDSFIYATLRIPLTNSPREFDEQISSLTKLLPESFDQKIIKNEIKELRNIQRNKDIGIAGGINLLEEYLKLMKIDVDVITDIIKPLRIIQSIRSEWGTAHRRGSEKKIFSKIGLENLSFINRMKTIIENLTKSLDLLCDVLKTI